MIAEARDKEGDKALQAIDFISSAYKQSSNLHTTEYKKAIKHYYEHKLTVFELTDNDSTVARQAAEKVLSLLNKYERKELSLVLESVLRLKDKLVTSAD